ncbi:MAG: choice-of-anchor tandem repeat GloVer-containing protein [Terriglobales bacterium]
MRIRIHRLCALALISLLWLFAFAGQAQGQSFNQLTHSPKLQAKAGTAHRANAADGAASYVQEVLYNFCSESKCADGEQSSAGLIRDAAGNLYGTTPDGGANGAGTVFRLAPSTQAGGAWTETVLHSFCSASNCTDGSNPAGALIQDAAGNLYGTTESGGANTTSHGGQGGGAVFKLAPPAQPGGTWTETVLYSFCSESSCTDGQFPRSGLTQDSAGNLYGTTQQGGAYTSGDGGFGAGTVFEISPPAQQGGAWTETVLHSFCSAGNYPSCSDGYLPIAGLMQDAAGNLYGTTYWGGTGWGIVFEVSPPAQQGGAWTETVLHTFCSVELNCTDGQEPQAGLVQDAAGNLYGTTTDGGANTSAKQPYGGGTVFKLAPPAQQGGAWTETLLYSFCSASNCADGVTPKSGLIQDAAGNLYGATPSGGANNLGTAFRLNSTGQETVLYSFCSVGGTSCTDGEVPSAGLVQDAAGNLYGITQLGGADYYGGTVFELAVPTFTVATTAVSVSPGATSGNTSTITLTPSGGFTGSVTLTAAITSSPSGAQNLPTVSFGSTSPVSISGASAVTATLTIATTAPTTGALAYPARPGLRWYAGGTTLVFGLCLGIGICIPARRRSWRTRMGALVLLVILAVGLLACGSSSSGGGGTGNPGTTPGAYTVTVTGASGSTTATGTVTLTVQ